MNSERIFKVLLSPHISEKAHALAAGDSGRQFVFRVAKNATKYEIREAVEQLFKVQVERIAVLNVKGKVKRTRQGAPRRCSSWKKAYVRLAEGQDINLAETG